MGHWCMQVNTIIRYTTNGKTLALLDYTTVHTDYANSQAMTGWPDPHAVAGVVNAIIVRGRREHKV